MVGVRVGVEVKVRVRVRVRVTVGQLHGCAEEVLSKARLKRVSSRSCLGPCLLV